MPAGSKSSSGSTSTAPTAQQLLEHLISRAPAEDLAPYDDGAIKRTAEIAYAALKRHRKGDSLVVIDREPGIERQGRRVSAITVINDNMPFLFDSVMGEISDGGVEPFLVMHPVLHVAHGKSGVTKLYPDGALTKGDIDKVSLIHVQVPQMSEVRAEALSASLDRVLADVRSAVTDWKPMLARLERAIATYRYTDLPLKKDAVGEAVAFLEWLRDDNFTFLGMRDYHYSGNEKTGTLERSDAQGLGILADPDTLVLRSGTEAVLTTPEVRAFLNGPDPLLVTKANTKSRVHRRIYLDYVGVKTFDARGKLDGELRIVGMFTSTAYTRSVASIPYLRSKAQSVIEKSGFEASDHSGKALINVIESYPRDELFQIDVPTLRKFSSAILALGERPRVRVLPRVDRFDRFVSVIVYVPRDRYDSIAREKIGDYLKAVYDGRLSAYYPAFPEGGLARVHFIIGRSAGKTPKVDPATLEAAVRDIVRNWEDAVADAAEEIGAERRFVDLAGRFPESYRGSFSAAEALHDAEVAATVTANNPIAVDYYRHADQPDHQAALKIHHFGAPVALSRRVPLLENMGFRVISERTFELSDEDGDRIFVHDMELENAFGNAIDLKDGGVLFEGVFLSVWRGETDNDGYNALSQTASLSEREILVLRAYGRYLQQAGIPQGQEFIAGVLNRYPQIARALHALFVARFDPRAQGDTDVQTKHLKSAVRDALQEVPSLDDDTIIRRFLNLIDASLRTNHFAETADDVSLAIKLESRSIDGLPEPRPWREIFVYGTEVEGVHLRFGSVARGGLRWSDRAQDYRTEVLGLVKAQQVKNAVIVPVGAKGGFFPKQLPAGGSRDAVFAAGTKAYVNFISSLLSITDNLDQKGIVPPKSVVRRDADDPYFVVAADKGTATFSDTANAISQAHDFWLDDAFASGGSAGYDHKKMGITARGAWEAVKRHFREMNRDIQTTPFSAVGVGDMSGDVFGNGMLLSHQTRLIAAFDHRDIFIDPDPDIEASFAERARMFALPRSSWADYDKTKISAGGGVFPRSSKSITLTKAAADAIGLDKVTASPTEIMNAILKAPVDLLWFGGIGTYVKGSGETNAEVGDRANDIIRVNAGDVRARVIGEGANLGVTQRGRIEFGLAGGAINSDAIDNSGGVNSSDLEVNIKIALAAAMRDKRLTRPARNKLLAEMTDEVASLVLANNYQQTLAISLIRNRGLAELGHEARFMTILEERGLLDRAVENLPTNARIAERAARGEPLTRPEIAVLLAYAKIVLFTDIIASDVPDDPHFDRDLMDYFPGKMQKKFKSDIEGHRLRREVIARVVSNDLINRGGATFVTRLQEATGRTAREVVRAFAVVRDGFDMPDVFAGIDALDNRIDGQVQLDLYAQACRLIYVASAWDLKNGDDSDALGKQIAALREARESLRPKLAELAPVAIRERIASRREALIAAQVPAALAERLSRLELAEFVPDIALVARRAKAGLVEAARAYFAVTEAFRIGRIEDAARALSPSDYYDGMALSRAEDTIAAARRSIAIAALTGFAKSADPVADWLASGGERIGRLRERLQALTEGGDITVSRLSVAAGLMGDLA
ncbi:MAG: NAD-glutamate dehydrogenase [Mesorhizobium sp.]